MEPAYVKMRCETLHPNQNTLSRSNIYALVTMNIITALTNIILNTVIAYSLWRTKMIKTTSFKFIFLLSMSDCVMGLTICPVIVTLLVLQRLPFCLLEHYTQLLTFVLGQFSGLMVVVITLDRYLHMRYLTRYNLYMTRKKARILIALNFNSCLLTGILLILASTYGFIFQFEATLVAVYSTFVAIIFILYLKTFLTLRRRVNAMATINQTSNVRNDTHSRQKSELIFARGMIFVLLCTTVCYLPCFLSGTVWAHRKYVKKQEPPNWLHSTLFWTCILMYANSTFNPIVMLTFNKRLRKYIYSLIIVRVFRLSNHGNIDARDILHARGETTFDLRD